jgi:beta-N-acetylhexosaminidase
MTAHVAYPALDPAPGTPATLSHPIMTDLLRGKLGFQGVVVTDCMNMHSVAHNFDAREAAVRSVQAGCDLVLTDQWDLVHEALMRAVLEGELAVTRLHEASDRVRAVKARIFGPDLTRPRPIEPMSAQEAVGTAAHLQISEQIAAASITLVDGALTPPTGRPLILATRMARRFGPPVEAQLRAALEATGWNTADVLMLDPVPDGSQVQKAVEHARTAEWVALLHFNRVLSFDPDGVCVTPELMSLASSIADTDVPLAFVSMGSPYALPPSSQASARLCSYSTCDASLRATLRVLMGTNEAVGRLPVQLPAS